MDSSVIPPRILIVEDQAFVAEDLRRELEPLGYLVTGIAESGEQALRLIEEHRPDLILMDIDLAGDIDGIETVGLIPVDRAPAVIYLSAHDDAATLERARQSRPYGYLIKPCSGAVVHAAIMMALERHRGDLALRANEERLILALEAAEMGCWELDPDGAWIHPSGHADRILGLEEDGRRWALAAFIAGIDPSDRPAIDAMLTNLAADEQLHRADFRLTRPDGAMRWLRMQGRACLVGTGARRIVGVVQDVTDARLTDTALSEITRTLTKVIDASPLAIMAVDEAGRISLWNPAAERLYGVPAAAAIGQPPAELRTRLAPLDTITSDDLMARLRTDGVIRDVEVRRLRSDGARLDLSVSAALLDHDQDSTGALFIVDDISRRKATEEQLRQAQKMDAVGLLTGGIAHDFNNLLAVVQGNLELIREQAAPDSPLADLAGDAYAAGARGASLTQRLLAYSRQQQLAPKIVDVAKLVGNLGKLLRRVLEESVQIIPIVAPNLWTVLADEQELESALLNLAVNARDAMPDGGRLLITAENAILDEEYAGQHAEVAAGPYVMLAFTDNGTGMPKEVLDRALEPFFTTKPVGRGTGLGLSMVYGFVKQSGGHLKLYSEPGHGTTVRLYLPEAHAVEEPKVEAGRFEGLAAGRGESLILVIEDDPAVRTLQVRVLNSLGYRTLEAGDGPAGLALLDANPAVDLLLTDIVLPKGMSGPAIAAEACLRRPGLKVVYMSGYAPTAVIRAEELRGWTVLSKPFTRIQLASAVRAALERAG
jgi:PAS domain S-box-containing protein